MKISQKTLAICGFVLIALIFVAGVVFSPSGFVTAEPGATQGLACVKLGTSADRCDGADAFWKTHTFNSKDICNQITDDFGHHCYTYPCTCKYLPE